MAAPARSPPEHANDDGTNCALQLGIPGTTTVPAFLGFPSFKPSGYASLGDNASTPITFVVNDYDGSDLVTWTSGKHNFKFGGDILHVQLFQPTNTNKNGAFTYNGKFTNSRHSTRRPRRPARRLSRHQPADDRRHRPTTSSRPTTPASRRTTTRRPKASP